MDWYFKQYKESQIPKIALMIDKLVGDVEKRVLDKEAKLHAEGKEFVLGTEFTTEYMAINGSWYDKNTTLPIYVLASNYTDAWQNVSEEALSANPLNMSLNLNGSKIDDDDFDGDGDVIIPLEDDRDL